MLWNRWKVVYGLRLQISRVCLTGGTRYLTLRGIEWDSRLVTIDEQGMLLVCKQIS